MGMVSRLGQIGIHDHRIVQRHTFLQFGLVWFMTTGYELQIAGVEKIFFMSDGLKVLDGLGVAEPTFLK